MVPVRLSSIGAIVPAVLATVAGYTAQAFGPEGCASGLPSVPDWEVRGTRIYGGWGCGGDRRTPVHAALYFICRVTQPLRLVDGLGVDVIVLTHGVGPLPAKTSYQENLLPVAK